MTANRSPWARRKHAAGFTLTEIMVVVAIIGILAAIAVLQYQSQAMHARVAGALEFASESRMRVALELAQGKNVPTDLLNNGGKPVNDITSLVWIPGKSGEPVAGHILATMKLPGQGTRNVFALEMKQGVWQCVNAAKYADPATALDNDYLPAACRDGAAPIAPPAGTPADPELEIKSACVGGDLGSFKGKSEGKGKPQLCESDTSATGGAATTGGSGRSGGNAANSDASSANLSGATGSAEDKGGSTTSATATVPDKMADGTAATADARGNSAGAAGKGDGTRSPGTGSGPTTPGGPTAICGANFEVVNNTCALAGSPSPRLCRSSKENCETAHAMGRDCPAAQPFAANVVENLSDGTHYLTRRCVSLGEAFQGVKKNRETQACTDYDAGKVLYARFTCMYPCYGIDCNRDIVPGDSATRLTWDNDVVEAGSGRKRGKTGADLPDIFDNWACPRGTMPDKQRVGHCARDTPATAAASDGKSPAGAKK